LIDRAEALELLDKAEGKVKTAIVMQIKGLDQADAERLLAEHEGKIRPVLEV